MAAGDITITSNTVFPIGQTVGLYEATAANHGGAPRGAELGNAPMTSDGITFTGFVPGGTYVVAAEVAGEWVYVFVTADAEPSGRPHGPWKTGDYEDGSITAAKFAFEVGVISQSGALDGDVATWDDGQGLWVPSDIKRATVSRLEVVGNSIARAAYGIEDDSIGWPRKLAGAVGGPSYDNIGVDAAVMCWPTDAGRAFGNGGFAHVLQELTRPRAGDVASLDAYLPVSQIVTISPPINDLAVLGSAKPLPMQEAYKTIIGWLMTASAIQNEDTAYGTVAYTGAGWGVVLTTLYNSGDSVHATVNATDKVTFTYPSDAPEGRVMNVRLMITPGQTLTVGVQINGVDQADIVLVGNDVCDSASHFGGQVNTITRRFGTDGSLGPGDTVRLEMKSSTPGGTGLVVDGASIEVDPLDGPLIEAMLCYRQPDYSAYNNADFDEGPGMVDADVTAWNTALASVLDDYPENVIAVDTDSVMEKDTTKFLADNLHPNARGHADLSSKMQQELVGSRLLTPRVFSRPKVSGATLLTDDELVTPEDWTAPTLGANWSNVGSGFNTAGYFKDRTGRVWLKGLVVSSAGSDTTPIFTLPATHRPASDDLRIVSVGLGFGSVKTAAATGIVSTASGAGTDTWVSLDGISFRTDA